MVGQRGIQIVHAAFKTNTKRDFAAPDNPGKGETITDQLGKTAG
jgi:hypothetical protein